MGFANDTGYTPLTVAQIMDLLMAEVNNQFGTTYNTGTFLGTNWYKFFYVAAQRMQKNEVKASEIFLQLQNYIKTTNEKINRPANTSPGIIENLKTAGYTASIKAPLDADAGKLYVCVQLDNTDPAYATTKLAVNTLLKGLVTGGIVTQGTEVSTIALTNGQSFDWKFKLPNKITPLLRLTTWLSKNNQVKILTPETQKANLIANIAAKYSLGKNFEPQRYFCNVDDAPWAERVLLEYSLDAGATWASSVYSANYDDLFVILLANVSLVEN